MHFRPSGQPLTGSCLSLPWTGPSFFLKSTILISLPIFPYFPHDLNLHHLMVTAANAHNSKWQAFTAISPDIPFLLLSCEFSKASFLANLSRFPWRTLETYEVAGVCCMALPADINPWHNKGLQLGKFYLFFKKINSSCLPQHPLLWAFIRIINSTCWFHKRAKWIQAVTLWWTQIISCCRLFLKSLEWSNLQAPLSHL